MEEIKTGLNKIEVKTGFTTFASACSIDTTNISKVWWIFSPILWYETLSYENYPCHACHYLLDTPWHQVSSECQYPISLRTFDMKDQSSFYQIKGISNRNFFGQWLVRWSAVSSSVLSLVNKFKSLKITREEKREFQLISRTTIVGNGRYTFYQIQFIKHNLSNSMH